MKVSGEWIDGSTTQAVFELLTDAGHQAFVVGGCVRNALLGVPVTDIDITTDARPERVMDLAEAAGLKAVPTGIEHGTVTIVCQGEPHEITTFRRDVETDGRRAVVAYASSIAEDAHRRDFTMNALYADPSGTVHDPLGGLPDLTARRVRFIDDATARIREDYLRILRFFRFHAWYGDEENGLDPEALAACAELADGLIGISNERVGAETLKLLGAPDPAPAVAAMAQTGVLARVLPNADARGLPILIHEEARLGVAPDARRRLAVLGGNDRADALRLSKVDARRLDLLGRLMGSADCAATMGFVHGAEVAHDALLLRAATFEQPVAGVDWAAAETGAGQVFPVAARDLMPDYSGPALGARMTQLQSAWIASGFTLSRDELLALPVDPAP